ncbi:DNA polymerase [Olene mendosa nucleopolyhedrovirus]|uniref:DNA polymerase n=1 Tax=Olene mendosa nucleopolyhedrovirus TaxID=2933796 RepID=A0AAX3AUV5_9ABAC|nr:DNA polymerase [Olene mendosa nucleopolyhedrovirus]UOQ18856.1 DNA polymerase [Olene mendosa nucleopolyhedrovirus]
MQSANLMEWSTLKTQLQAAHDAGKAPVSIGPEDTARITRMTYDDNHLIVFMNARLAKENHRLYQFYAEVRCDLYSYKSCYATHASATCHRNCTSYKTFVMPGLRDVHTDKLHVVKFKRSDEKRDKNCLDCYLTDINRVHMQTSLLEGQYVRFKKAHICRDYRLSHTAKDVHAFESLLERVQVSALSHEILPVVACYDIETHSDGQRFSSPDVDFIISVAVVVRRDAGDTRICLFYAPDDPVDLDSSTDSRTAAVRFRAERDMIAAFFQLLPLLNADVVLDFNGDKFDMPFLTGRANKLCGPAEAARVTKVVRYDLSPVSVVTQLSYDKFSNKLHSHYLTYYIHIDLYQFLSTDSEHNDLENFQLNTVAEHYLKTGKVDLPIAEMLRMYKEKRLSRIVEYNVQDCVLPVELFLKLEIADYMYTQCMLLYLCTDDLLRNISHKITVAYFHLALTNTVSAVDSTPDPYFFNKYDLSVTSGRKRAFNESAPDATNAIDLSQLKRTPVDAARVPPSAVKLCSTRQSCTYKGGKVLSPKPGFNRWVATLDFNALYPTIMMWEGVCMSNVFIASDGNVYLDKNVDAVNPKLLKTLSEMRVRYKGLRDQCDYGSFYYKLYDKIQNALKRIANSIYGYYGIFFKPLANYITKVGRGKLKEVVSKVEAMSDDPRILREFALSKINFSVIYGDTDSCFIRVSFDEAELAPDRRQAAIRSIVQDHVCKTLNDSWCGYKMSLENIMLSLILLKKKKYCYLNNEQRTKYKGWLIKRDMPLFMRKTFRATVDALLHGHSVACALSSLADQMHRHYREFGATRENLADYCFSMSYNETSTTAKRRKEEEPTRKPVITIAKHCRELLANSGVDFLPGNGDRIQYVLVDIKEKITQKAYPLKLFDPDSPTLQISWLKHMNILCTFVNELIQVFGNRPEFEHYFGAIVDEYTSGQMYDVRYPVLVPTRVKATKSVKKKDGDSDSDSDSDTENPVNYHSLFSMHLKRPKKTTVCAFEACPRCAQDV